MNQRTVVVAGFAVTLVAAHLGAIMAVVDARKVPVDRLVANLERAAAANPSAPEPQINLARLHIMSYALKTDSFPAVVGRGTGQNEIPYYPPGSTLPRAVQRAPSEADATKAASHLQKALTHYDAALALAPNHPIATLGRGWARKEAGDQAGAIADFRTVIAAAWPKDSTTTMRMPFQDFLTQEAIDYLLPLLDPKRDAAEIADLHAKHTDLKNRPRAITPIAVPLSDDADVTSIVDPRARVRFDADGSALDREWTWITPRAGWLVYDHEGRGQITSALQLFGNVTFWLFWSNGYDALAALDDDGNRRLEQHELRQLAVWHDINENGRSETGEVASLAAHGIGALSFDYVEGDGEAVAAFAPRGVILKDGRTRPTYDVILHHAGRTFTN